MISTHDYLTLSDMDSRDRQIRSVGLSGQYQNYRGLQESTDRE